MLEAEDQVRISRELDKAFTGTVPVLRADRKELFVLGGKREV